MKALRWDHFFEISKQILILNYKWFESLNRALKQVVWSEREVLKEPNWDTRMNGNERSLMIERVFMNEWVEMFRVPRELSMTEFWMDSW